MQLWYHHMPAAGPWLINGTQRSTLGSLEEGRDLRVICGPVDAAVAHGRGVVRAAVERDPAPEGGEIVRARQARACVRAAAVTLGGAVAGESEGGDEVGRRRQIERALSHLD